MTEATPRCPSCESRTLVCPGCDDTRPAADELYTGWMIVSPFNRWETVTRTERHQYGQILVYTDQTGDGFAWTYHASDRVTAVRPLLMSTGKPQIRIIEYAWADGPMYALATTSSVVAVNYEASQCLVEARHLGRGKGWVVSHRRNGSSPPRFDDATETNVVTDHVATKAQARAALTRAARQIGKQLQVEVYVPGKK